MANVRIVPNRKGIAALLKEPGVAADLTRRGHAVAGSAGPEHQVHTELGPHRWRVAVVTSSFRAYKLEATQRNLVRAVDAAR